MVTLKKFNIFISNLKKYKLFFFQVKYFGYTDANITTCFSRDIPIGKKIIIYGFGPYGQEYFINCFSKYKIIDLYDLKYKKINKKIKNPNKINFKSFDYVIVTVMNINARKSVLHFLKYKQVSEEQIILIKPSYS